MSKLDFSYLITPFTGHDFFVQYWQKTPLLVRSAEADRFQTLVPASTIDSMLSLAEPLPTEVVELVGRAPTSEQGPRPSGSFPEFFAKGSTIRAKGVEKYWKQVGTLCRSIEQEMRCPTRANLYCTPPSARGFDLHLDTHEVFVLQLLGKKRWQVYEPIFTLPLEHVPALSFEHDQKELSRSRGGREAGQDSIKPEELGAIAVDTVLESGDCLYLPRGFVHQAESLNEPSVHLTIGIHVLTWLDLFSVALGQSAYRNEAFRQALPNGFSDKHQTRSELEREFARRVELFSQDVHFERALDELEASFSRSRSADPHTASSASLNPDTRLKGNGRLQVYVSADGNMVGLALGQNIFWMPASFTPALSFVVESQSFCAYELPQLTESGRLNLLRRLIDDGYLRIAD